MKTLAFLAVVTVALSISSSASAAGCTPLDCAPNDVVLPGGALLAARPLGTMGRAHVVDLRDGRTLRVLPSGFIGGSTLVHQDGGRVEWRDAATGRLVAVRTLGAPGWSLVGVSQDGRRAVVEVNAHRRTTFVVAGPRGAAVDARLGRGTWAFDALDGNRLYLLRYLRNGYQVRLFDLGANRLVARPLKDPDGSSSFLWGSAWARASSPDGRYLFTLYVAPDGGAMVHELDLRGRTARCVSLPGDGDPNAAMSTALALSPDGRTLWVVSPGYGRVTGIDVRAARVRTAFRFARTTYLVGDDAVAAMAPGGRRIAVAAHGYLWRVDLRRRSVTRLRHDAYALGFAPDGARLWVVSGPARVSSVGF
jgi:hypothetical protein